MHLWYNLLGYAIPDEYTRRRNEYIEIRDSTSCGFRVRDPIRGGILQTILCSILMLMRSPCPCLGVRGPHGGAGLARDPISGGRHPLQPRMSFFG